MATRSLSELLSKFVCASAVYFCVNSPGSLSVVPGVLSITDTDGHDIASATKFVSPFTYLMSVVNSAIKVNCLDCRSDGRSLTDDITKVNGLWSVFTKKLRPSKLCLKCLIVAYTAKSAQS